MLPKNTTIGLVILLVVVIGLPAQAFSAGLFTNIKDKAIMKWAGCYKKGRVIERQCDDGDRLDIARIVTCQQKADNYIMKCRMDKTKLKPGANKATILTELEAVRDRVKDQVNECREGCSDDYAQAFREYAEEFNANYRKDKQIGKDIKAIAKKRIKTIKKDTDGQKAQRNRQKLNQSYDDMIAKAQSLNVEFQEKRKLAYALNLHQRACQNVRGDHREPCTQVLMRSIKAVDKWKGLLKKYKKVELGPGPGNEHSQGPKREYLDCQRGCDALENRLYRSIIPQENAVLEQYVNTTQ